MIYDLCISYCFLLSFLKLKFWGIIGCVFGFRGKTWVSFYLPLVFSPTLDRPKKFEWYIYQVFLSLLLWMLGYEPPFHTRAHALNQTGPGSGGARTRPVDTNTTSFKGFLNLLLFENYFLPFKANSELLGEVIREPGHGMILEHLKSKSSPSTRSNLGVISEWTPSTRTWDHP